MSKSRIEAFSDGVIAILITIMVLELKVPHGESFTDLIKLWPTFLSYVLSFVYLGIYWNNHHHMFHAGRVLWANMHLLFWLSLLPFATAWAGENGLASAPIATYGVVLAMAAVAYYMLSQALVKQDGTNSPIERAIGRDLKGRLSIGLYLAAIPLAYVLPLLSIALYVLVALLWVVPDQRVERTLKRGG